MRYTKDYPENLLSAEEALTGLLQYFWLSHKHKQDKKLAPNNIDLRFTCAIHSEMREIDDMWHTFLLFTHEYTDFCKKYFKQFIHHVPNVEEKKWVIPKIEVELNRYLSYVYDHLGEETLCKWFAEHIN